MARYRIELDKIPNQTIRVKLDEKSYNLTFITRNGHIYLNEMDIEDEKVLCGIICLNKTNIFQYIDFKGKLYFEDLNGNENPVYTGFNDRFILVYEDGVDV